MGKQKTVLAIGAVGAIGTYVVDEAIAAGYKVKALILDAEKSANLPEEVDVAVGDFDDTFVLSAALHSVDGIILILGQRSAFENITENIRAIKNIPQTTLTRNLYTRSGLEYSIAPVDATSEIKHGGFSIGTSYNESIDTSDLGFTASFYTKYETKHFALTSAYNKESGIDYSMNIDKFLVAPEFKLNNHISVKGIISSDITRNRKKNELVLSVKPTKSDRIRFELGTNYTFDDTNSLIRSQVKFSTQYKW